MANRKVKTNPRMVKQAQGFNLPGGEVVGSGPAPTSQAVMVGG